MKWWDGALRGFSVTHLVWNDQTEHWETSLYTHLVWNDETERWETLLSTHLVWNDRTEHWETSFICPPRFLLELCDVSTTLYLKVTVIYVERAWLTGKIRCICLPYRLLCIAQSVSCLREGCGWPDLKCFRLSKALHRSLHTIQWVRCFEDMVFLTEMCFRQIWPPHRLLSDREKPHFGGNDVDIWYFGNLSREPCSSSFLCQWKTKLTHCHICVYWPARLTHCLRRICWKARLNRMPFL